LTLSPTSTNSTAGDRTLEVTAKDNNSFSLTTSFTAPARGGKLRVVGTKRGGGSNTFFASAEIFDEAGTLVAFGEGTFRYRTKRVKEY
jgi:acyl-coenzyme A thioesterase PaaI-like protein